jgi:hypothetical protein
MRLKSFLAMNAMGLNDEISSNLQSYLLLNPEAGSMIQGTGVVLKIAVADTGKREKECC